MNVGDGGNYWLIKWDSISSTGPAALMIEFNYNYTRIVSSGCFHGRSVRARQTFQQEVIGIVLLFIANHSDNIGPL